MFFSLFKGEASYNLNVELPNCSNLTAVCAVGVLLFLSSALGVAIYELIRFLLGVTFQFDFLVWEKVQGREEFPFSVQALISVLISQVVLVPCVLFSANKCGGNIRTTLALRRPPVGWHIVIPVLFCFFGCFGVFSLLMVLFWPTDLFLGFEPYISLLRSSYVGLLFLIAVIGAPLSEELLIRGFLFGVLVRNSVDIRVSSCISSIVWALLHANYSFVFFLVVFVIGLFFSWLLWRTGSLLVTILCHSVYNLCVFFVFLLSIL